MDLENTSDTASGERRLSRRTVPQRGDKQYGRSAVTNHQDLLPGVKGTSSAARRFRDLVGAFIADMGGAALVSDIKLGLLRRLAAVTVQSELLEARMVNGEPVSISELCTLASTSVRLSSRLGVERVPKPIESLQAYLKRTVPDGGRGEYETATDAVEGSTEMQP
jgi:hypothetical protein